METWCIRKFQGKNEQVARRREELCPDRDWRFMLVYDDLKHPEELPLLEGQGVEVKHIRDVLNELRNLKDTRTSSEASGVAELLEICREDQGEAPTKRLEALESENAEQLYSLVEGGRLEPGMLVFNIGGNAKDGSVPEGDDVVEEITNITPAAPSHGQEYVNLHLKAVKSGATRTKYLSEAKKVKAKAGEPYTHDAF